MLICEIVFYRCGADAAKRWCSNANWRCSARERINYITLYKFGYEFQQHLAENKYDQYILHVIRPGGMTQISFRVEVEQSKLSLIAEDMNDITTIIELFDYFAACTEPNGKTAEIWLTPPPDNDEEDEDEED